jgi:hypothetical protein
MKPRKTVAHEQGAIDKPKGILHGVDEEIRKHIFFSDGRKKFNYTHLRTCNELSKSPPNFDGLKLIECVYQRINENLKNRPVRKLSEMNWTPHLELKPVSKNNTSAEVTLERAIVQQSTIQQATAQQWRGWSYQMPIASGLFGPETDKRRAVDLVYGDGNGRFDFVELKWESHTPLFAAMEILGYGLVYLASRKDSAGKLKYPPSPVLNAKAINLIVLAPSQYYKKSQLKWLEQGLNVGLTSFVMDIGVANLEIGFCFKAFRDFKWNHKMDYTKLPDKLECKPVYL